METLLLTIVALMILWWLPQLIKKTISPLYNCILEKNIELPENVVPEEYKIPFMFGIELKKKVALPFPPQIGMSISEFVDVLPPKNKNDMDGKSVKFISENIERIHWDNSNKVFTCSVTTHKLSQEKELGLILAGALSRGWKLSNDGAIDIIKDSLSRWETEILRKESVDGKTLDADREYLNEIREIIKMRSSVKF